MICSHCRKKKIFPTIENSFRMVKICKLHTKWKGVGESKFRLSQLNLRKEKLQLTRQQYTQIWRSLEKTFRELRNQPAQKPCVPLTTEWKNSMVDPALLQPALQEQNTMVYEWPLHAIFHKASMLLTYTSGKCQLSW